MNKNYSKLILSLLTSKFSIKFRLVLMVLFVIVTPLVSFGQTQIFTRSGTFTVPCDVTSITVKVWGAGGGGHNSNNYGGGGGAFAQSSFSVASGNVYAITVGSGAGSGTGDNGGDSSFANVVVAKGGKGGSFENGGQASASIGDIKFNGGNGGKSTGNAGAGAGAGAGISSDGNSGGSTINTTAGSGGLGINGGGSGGNGGTNSNSGSNGFSPGGGGGERGKNGGSSGGGGDGRVEVIYTSSIKAYCTPSYNGAVEPITNVTFAGINNTTTNITGGPSLELFCSPSASVIQGSAINAISVKGNTVGNYTEYIKAYVDWDQNGVFGNSTNEIFDLGTITNSTGIDAKFTSGNIAVPATAIIGSTTMRVVKTYFSNGVNSNNPCFIGNDWGQAEDYIINVISPLPVITSLGASSGCVGSSVTINGRNLSGATATTVKIGGTSVTSITSISATQIVAVIGSGTTGSITVTTPSGTATSSSVFTVNPPTVGGTISGGTTVCSGTNSTELTLAGHTGTVVRWESSLDNFATTGSAIANTSTTLIATNLSATTSYRTVLQSGSCSIANSSLATVTINPPSVGGTVTGGTTICLGSTSGLMTLTGHTGTITKWQSSVSPFSTWTDIANTTATYTSGALSATTQFRAVVQSGSCAVVNSVVTTVMVNNAPTITPNKVDETCATANDGSISPTLSGGITNVRYIKLTQKYVNSDAWQQVAEIEAFEIFTGTNVARSTNGASATSSSNYSSQYTAPIAIDGNNSGNNNFWHSGTPNLNEWIKVDLQSGKNLNNIRIYNRTDCCSQRGQNMLLELFDSSDNLIYSKTIDLYQSGANIPVNVNVLDVSWADSATTLNRTGLDSATYILNYADAIGCSLSSPINIGSTIIAAPTRGTITPVTCNVPVASVILNNLPSAGTWTLMQSGTSTATITGTGISATVSGLAPGTYTFSVSIDGCSASNPVVVKIDSLQETVWNGAWSNGLPNSDKKLIFTANYNQTTDLVACSCEVTLGNVIVKSDKTLTLTNELKVSGGTLTFENNASLVQINEDPTINSGAITYQRETVTAVDKFDYTYWSSPVSAQTLYNASPNTLWDKYMSFDAVNNNWKQENSSKVMERGVGYIIRGPQSHYAPNPIGTYRANFIGVPHNGTIPVAITATAEASYLLGNPYPSALDADLFLQVNEDVLDGTLYFWTHNTDIAPSGSNYIYDSDDYASYNLLGGVGTAAASDVNPIPTIPSGEIASSQGFFATSIAPGTVNFTNTMRLIGNVNSQFFRSNSKSKKNASFDKNRLWLNFSNTEGAFKQTLIGYATGATNEYERTFDGISFDGNTFVDFYSVFEDKNFVIQGRALPFLQSDQVPLGYKTTIAGAFTITIFQTDGFLTTQNVFLEDKMLGIIHNLKESPYGFTTQKGTFNERFVLRYTDKTLGTGDFESQEKTIVVFKEKNELKIKSEFETMKRVTVFDLLGKKVFEETLKDVNEFRTSNITLKNQIVIVKVVLTNGQVVAKKVSY